MIYAPSNPMAMQLCTTQPEFRNSLASQELHQTNTHARGEVLRGFRDNTRLAGLPYVLPAVLM